MMMASGEIRLSGTTTRQMPVLAQSQDPTQSQLPTITVTGSNSALSSNFFDPSSLTINAGSQFWPQQSHSSDPSLLQIVVQAARFPDYVTFDLNLYVFSISATYTRYGDIFLNKGVGRSYPYPSLKTGVSISDGWYLTPGNAVPSQDALNNFLSDWSGSAGGYFGVGGSYSFNAAGGAINLGVGFGGFGVSPGTIGTYQGNFFGNQ